MNFCEWRSLLVGTEPGTDPIDLGSLPVPNWTFGLNESKKAVVVGFGNRGRSLITLILLRFQIRRRGKNTFHGIANYLLGIHREIIL